MKSLKYVKVNKDVLLEWVYSDEDFYTADYTITIDTSKNTSSFSNSADEEISSNLSDRQVFSLDSTANRWAFVDTDPDTNRFLYIQNKDFSGNTPHTYDTARVHFPISYNFNNFLGFVLNIGLLNKSGDKIYYLANFFFDKTDPLRSDIEYTSPPFMFQEKLWGKYIDIKIPSPDTIINDISILNGVREPREGSIHKNLGQGDIMASDSPIFIQFQHITDIDDSMNQRIFITETPFKTSIPSVPEFKDLAVKIEKSSNGDYFEISGIYSGSVSDYNTFMENGIYDGKRYYAVYEISIFEKNVKTSTLNVSQYENFDIPIDFRPIIKYSATTAVIDVSLKVINSVDDSTIIRKATYGMIQDEVSKYARNLTKINVDNVYKPKIYNQKLGNTAIPTLKNSGAVQKVKVPSTVIIERYNINAKNLTESVNDTVWYGLGLQQILLYPSDNVVKFAIGNGTTKEGIKPFEIPTDSDVFLRFKSNKAVVDTPLYTESGEVNLSNGIVIFMIAENMYNTIQSISADGYDQFYIVMRNSMNVSTVIYAGRFLLYQG